LGLRCAHSQALRQQGMNIAVVEPPQENSLNRNSPLHRSNFCGYI